MLPHVRILELPHNVDYVLIVGGARRLEVLGMQALMLALPGEAEDEAREGGAVVEDLCDEAFLKA